MCVCTYICIYIYMYVKDVEFGGLPFLGWFASVFTGSHNSSAGPHLRPRGHQGAPIRREGEGMEGPETPCAFRLRGLAQTLRPDLGPPHFSCKFSHKMALVACPCAFRLRRLARSVRSGVLKLLVIFIVNSCINEILRRYCKIPFQEVLHDPVQVLNRRSCGVPGEILCKRSLHEDLADAMSWRCLYEISCGRLSRCPCIKIWKMLCIGACIKVLLGCS